MTKPPNGVKMGGLKRLGCLKNISKSALNNSFFNYPYFKNALF